jgi:hypothetical protein
MSPQRPLARPATLIGCFATVTVVMIGVHLVCRPSRTAPSRDLPALKSYLVAHGFENYEVRPQALKVKPSENPLCGGFYLVAPDVEINRRRLLRDRSQLCQWRGVLACSQASTPEDWWCYSEDCYECAHWAGGFAFFGDPEEVAKVRALLP